jgi:peptidoglycan/LPS O-acetylase OafA/YrhL
MRAAHIQNLTGLRGFAALSVLLLHIRYGDLANDYEPFAFLFKTRGLGVDVFFILSGFILAYVHGKDFAEKIRSNEAISFWVARLARIYPVHLFMLVVTAFFLPMHLLYEWSPADTKYTLYANLFLVHAWGVTSDLTFNQPSWSISCEWAAYLTFPFVAYFTRKWGKIPFALLLIGLALYAPYLQPNMLTAGVWTIKCIVYFVAGYCAYQVCYDLPDSKYWRITAIAIAPLIGLMFWTTSIQYYFDLIFPLLVVIMIASLFRAGPIWIYSNPVSVYFGKISFSLYMCHIMVLFVERKLFGMMDLKFEIPIIIAFSMFLYHCIEEPSRKIIRMVSEGRHNERPLKSFSDSFALPAPDPEQKKENTALA